jgi:hypothetical protein
MGDISCTNKTQEDLDFVLKKFALLEVVKKKAYPTLMRSLDFHREW